MQYDMTVTARLTKLSATSKWLYFKADHFVGAPKTGTELNARVIFKAAGLAYEDMGKLQYLPFAESVELIKNRQLDATLQSSGLGMAAIRDLSSVMPLNDVPMPVDVVAKLGNPAYQRPRQANIRNSTACRRRGFRRRHRRPAGRLQGVRR